MAPKKSSIPPKQTRSGARRTAPQRVAARPEAADVSPTPPVFSSLPSSTLQQIPTPLRSPALLPDAPDPRVSPPSVMGADSIHPPPPPPPPAPVAAHQARLRATPLPPTPAAPAIERKDSPLQDTDDLDGLSDYERQQILAAASSAPSGDGNAQDADAGGVDAEDGGNESGPTAQANAGRKKKSASAVDKEPRHKWTNEERSAIVKFMKSHPLLQQAMLPGRSDSDSGRKINTNTLLRECAQYLNEECGSFLGKADPQAFLPVRRQIEYMDSKYEAALKELSVTGRGKDASEIPREGPLQVERQDAVKKCFYFEDWHAMRRDRRTSAPRRGRVGGGEGLIALEKNGLRAGSEDGTEDDDEDEDEGEEDGQDTQDTKEPEKDNDKKGKKRALSPASGPTGGSSKKSQRSSTAVDDLAATMEASIHERNEQATIRQQADAEMDGERLQIEKEKLEIQRMDAETRRMEAINAREAQKQQGDLIMAMLSRMN